MNLDISPLPDGLGARVECDLARPTAADAATQLTAALHRYRLLVVPDQHLNLPDLLGAAGMFGPVDVATDRRYTVPGFPSVTVVSNIRQGGQPIGIYDGDEEEEWHADNSFKPELNRATLLYSIITPEVGGHTRFADATRAYADLPDNMKAQVDGLHAVHSIAQLAGRQAEAAGGHSSTASGTLSTLPEVTHLLAPAHPVTGARALLLGSMVVTRIPELSEVDSRRLLDDLLAHATGLDYRYTHRWSQGDVVVWDNRALLHTASPCDSTRHARLLLRVAIG